MIQTRSKTGPTSNGEFRRNKDFAYCRKSLCNSQSLMKRKMVTTKKKEEALNDEPTSMENKAGDANKQDDDCADNTQGETFVDKSPPPKTRY